MALMIHTEESPIKVLEPPKEVIMRQLPLAGHPSSASFESSSMLQMQPGEGILNHTKESNDELD